MPSSINMHLRFKVIHKVFRYIKFMYNYLHNKKEDHLKVIKSLTTSKHIYRYIQDKRKIDLRVYHLYGAPKPAFAPARVHSKSSQFIQ